MKKLLMLILVAALVGCEQGSSTIETPGNVVKTDVVQEPSGRVLQWGIYTLVRGGEIIDSEKTTTGKAVSKPVITRDRETDRIPLIRNKYMAYQYRLSNLPGKRTVQLRRVLKHPEFKLPDGTTSTGSDFMINKKLERGEVFAFDTYALNEDYELVEGEWTFQIWFEDKMLVEQKFTTYMREEDASS
jgi:hypothetical protein